MGGQLSKHHASLIHKQTVPAVCVQVVISHNVNPVANEPSLEKRAGHELLNLGLALVSWF